MLPYLIFPIFSAVNIILMRNFLSKISFKYFLSILLLISFCTLVKAGDDSRFSYYWLNEFFSSGIKTAYAEYSYMRDTAAQESEIYSKNATTKIEFDFSTKVYSYQYNYEYKQDWASLTNQNTQQPPSQKEKFVDSKINHWMKVGDIGIYQEIFQREIPNWLHFDYLDSLFIDQAIFSNPLPVLSGIFNSDEFKVLKKIRKQNESKVETNGLWNCFEYDNSDNVVELSRHYLYTLNNHNLHKVKGIIDATISIRNYEDELVFIELLIPESYPAIIEGISVKYNDMKTKIYNFEINAVLNKFVPDLVADPKMLILDYLKQLQIDCDCDLSRFDND